jgi:hypothetical protein
MISENNYVYSNKLEKYIEISESSGKPLIEFDTNGEFLAIYTLEKGINYLTICNCVIGSIALKRRI